MKAAFVIFFYGAFAGYAFAYVGLKFEIMKLKSEQKRLKQNIEDCYQARKKYEDYKQIENNIIKHGFLKHGKQTTTEKD